MAGAYQKATTAIPGFSKIGEGKLGSVMKFVPGAKHNGTNQEVANSFLDPLHLFPDKPKDNKTPTPPVAIPPPTFEDAALSAEQQSDMLRKRRGRASTILNGEGGSTIGRNNLATNLLLGS